MSEFVVKELLKLIKQKDQDTETKLKILDCIEHIVIQKFDNVLIEKQSSSSSKVVISQKTVAVTKKNDFMSELSSRIKDRKEA